MCDTLYKKTKKGFFFAKNSDRSANEPNLTVFIPKSMHEEKYLHCTYITIDQVKETNAMVLVKPSWMWGAEMGINQYGLCIGNEAVFTKSKTSKNKSLIGMDFLRLALERCSTCHEALELLISLLEKHGQGGNCGFDKNFYYDNSYLIADRLDAYILETSGIEWVYKKIEKEGNISNRLQTRETYDLSSLGEMVDFAKKRTEPVFTFFSKSKHRQSCVNKSIRSDSKDFLSNLMDALRSHEETNQRKLFSSGSMASVCMHESFLGNHTTSSMIVDFENKEPILWLTSSSTPCLTLYKPVFFGVTESVLFSSEDKAFEYWLNQEYLKRAIYAGLIDVFDYQSKMSSLQKKMISIVRNSDNELNKSSKSELQNQCFSLEKEWLDTFASAIDCIKSNTTPGKGQWKKLNQRLGKNVFERTLKKRLDI